MNSKPVLASVLLVMSLSAYASSGESRRGDEVTNLGGQVDSSMWHGNALGLVLATIDTSVEVLLVDVEWHHNESGDVYPLGPNASGGRYWIVTDPPPGIPYVPQYRTDTYLVSTLLDGCPE